MPFLMLSPTTGAWIVRFSAILIYACATVAGDNTMQRPAAGTPTRAKNGAAAGTPTRAKRRRCCGNTNKGKNGAAAGTPTRAKNKGEGTHN